MSIHDVANLCRVCQKRGPNNMFSSLTTEPARGAFIRSTSIYTHPLDGLPQRLCRDCLSKCLTWLEFVERAKKSEDMFRNMIAPTKKEQASIHGMTKQPQRKMEPADEIVEEEVDYGSDGGGRDDSMAMYDDDDLEVEEQEHKSARVQVAPVDAMTMDNMWDVPLSEVVVQSDNNFIEDIHGPIDESITVAPPTINKHGVDPVILCPVANCVQEFVGFKNFESHCLQHVDKKNIVCPICELRYERSENFRNHMYIHANQKFNCPGCDKLFTRPKTLNDHMRDVHLVYAKKDVADMRRSELERTTRATEDPQEGNSTVELEQEEDGGVKVETDGNETFNDSFVSTMKKGLVACPVCKAPCDSHKAFEDHVRKHINRLAKACPICQKTFLRMDNLKCHMYSHTDATFKCPHCPRTFVNPKTLGTHLRDAHVKEMEEKPLAHHEQSRRTDGQTCSYCGKFFRHMGQLREHLKLHTSDAKYPCTICNQTFRLKASLNMHVGKMHKVQKAPRVSAPVQAACTLCSVVMPSKAELGQHMLSQHPNLEFMCKDCGDVLKSAQGLRLHRQTKHVNEPGVVCHECGRTFNKSYRLKEHMKTHSTECSFTCEMCAMQFTSMRSLTIHFQKAHKEERGQGNNVTQEEFDEDVDEEEDGEEVV